MWNYLRVRGEYLMGEIRNQEDLELPPRTRRIPTKNFLYSLSMRTTSAYAENTAKCDWSRGFTGNYLRVRGEYPKNAVTCANAPELPPRTRRIPIRGTFLRD